MNIVFMGTPDFSVGVLQSLIGNYDVNLVVTQPDKKVGRKREIRFTPVKELAIKHNIEVFQPKKIKEDYKKVIDAKPDLIVTAAYGQFIPEEILNYPKYGCINVHASLLPKYRGGSPIHKAITNGDEYSGVTIMYMVKKMDAGDIISQVKVKIMDEDTCASLHDKLSVAGSKLLIETIKDIVDGNINPIKQDESKVTYAYNITREEERINWNSTSREIFNHIRGFHSWPGTFTKLHDKVIKIFPGEIKEAKNGEPGEILSIDKEGILVKTKDSGYLIKELQVQGKKRVKVKEFINGNKLINVNDIFES